MKKLIFVRHGESTANQDRICAGHTDVPLTATGIQQAQEAGMLVSKQYGKVNLIVSSPLLRARQTADIIQSIVSRSTTVPIIEQPLCIERFRGVYEGQPGSIQDDMSDAELVAGGSESEQSMQKRSAELLDWLLGRPEPVILISSHNQFGRSFVAYCTGKQRDDVERLPNAAPFVIDISK